MKENGKFEIALSILKQIIEEKVPFALSLKNALKKYEYNDANRLDATAIVGCVLRHYLVFDYVIEKHYPSQKNDLKYALMMVQANALFLKRFKDDQIISFFLDKLNEEEMKLLNDFISLYSDDNAKLIPEDVKKDSIEFLSFRFNTPIWIIKMWQKHYGNKITFAILKANYRPASLTVGVNYSLCKKEQVKEKYPFLLPTEVDDVYYFEDKVTFKKLNSKDKSAIFPIRKATSMVIDFAEIDPFKGIAIFSSIPNNIHLSLISRFGKNAEMDVISDHYQYLLDVKKSIADLSINNISTYHCGAKQMITCISRKVSTFFVLPHSSNLDLLRSTPDYFLNVDQQKLDEYILEETTALEEASKFIDLFGNIVYMVPTICKKESIGVVETFLENHPDFELKEQKQFLPFEKSDSCLYYAILTKRKEND